MDGPYAVPGRTSLRVWAARGVPMTGPESSSPEASENSASGSDPCGCGVLYSVSGWDGEPLRVCESSLAVRRCRLHNAALELLEAAEWALHIIQGKDDVETLEPWAQAVAGRLREATSKATDHE